MIFSTSPAYAIQIRVKIKNQVGMLGKVTSAIGEVGGEIRGVDLIDTDKEWVTREITVQSRDSDHARQVVRKLSSIKGVKVEAAVDRTFLAHVGGKISVVSKKPIKTREDLSRVYTPGVARVSLGISQVHDLIYRYTIKGNTVGIVTDGTAVLGLGDIGPEGALPVMEGKASIFKDFAGLDAFPICLKTKNVEEIVNITKAISVVFGGINLEDISAPRCFEIESRLKKELDIPVFHDDQHGTATVVLAGLYNALKIVKKDFKNIKVVLNGGGASGLAVTKILLKMGTKNIIVCDTKGSIYRGRKENMNPYKEEVAKFTNPENLKCDVKQALVGADVFIGLSVANLLSSADISKMRKNAIVFAMANPTPEIMPNEALRYARIVATGRSDFPNQVNNALGYPGIFKGALSVFAREINDRMKIEAAKAIAKTVTPSELNEEHIMPSIFDKRVVPNVAKAVAEAAIKSKVTKNIPSLIKLLEVV